MAVAFHFITKRANLLRVAVVTALPKVDIKPSQFEGCIGPNPLNRFNDSFGPKERENFNNPRY
jgi:hypothetical protein